MPVTFWALESLHTVPGYSTALIRSGSRNITSESSLKILQETELLLEKLGTFLEDVGRFFAIKFH